MYFYFVYRYWVSVSLKTYALTSSLKWPSGITADTTDASGGGGRQETSTATTREKDSSEE